jgi:hypothetical protein
MGRSSELVNAADKLAGVQQLLLPVVVIGEYGCGIAQSRNADQNRQWLDDMVKDCDVLDVTDQSTHHLCGGPPRTEAHWKTAPRQRSVDRGSVPTTPHSTFEQGPTLRCSFGSTAPLPGKQREALFVKRIWSAAYVQMAQVAQRRFIFLTHAARKIRIVQMLISRGFRHIFQHAKAVLNGALTIRRHLIPSWQNGVAGVRLLCWRQFLPHLRALLHLLPLCRA